MADDDKKKADDAASSFIQQNATTGGSASPSDTEDVIIESDIPDAEFEPVLSDEARAELDEFAIDDSDIDTESDEYAASSERTEPSLHDDGDGYGGFDDEPPQPYEEDPDGFGLESDQVEITPVSNDWFGIPKPIAIGVCVVFALILGGVTLLAKNESKARSQQNASQRISGQSQTSAQKSPPNVRQLVSPTANKPVAESNEATFKNQTLAPQSTTALEMAPEDLVKRDGKLLSVDTTETMRRRAEQKVIAFELEEAVYRELLDRLERVEALTTDVDADRKQLAKTIETLLTEVASLKARRTEAEQAASRLNLRDQLSGVTGQEPSKATKNYVRSYD